MHRFGAAAVNASGGRLTANASGIFNLGSRAGSGQNYSIGALTYLLQIP
jgi:hypothetical protein